MTMIELLVALAIGVTVTLAVSTLLVASENHKRITTSSNDADQTGAYTFNALDRALRSAGSGFAQSSYAGTNQGVLGCRLNAGSFMPRPSAYPAPFSNYFLGGAAPAALHVAPVLIGAGQSDKNSSDVIVVMSASGGAGGVPRAVYGAGSNTTLVLQSTVGLNPYDVILVSQPGTPDCLIEQINSMNSTTITLNTGTYYYTAGSTTNIGTLAASTSSAVTDLANESAATSPNNTQFMLFGVGTNNMLYSYDLLQYQTIVVGPFSSDLQAVADQVIQMNAIYGVATTANPSVFHNWANPADTAHGYDIYTVMSTPATQQLIVAVRVAIVVRGEYYDKKTVSPTSLTLFNGLVDGYGNSLAKTVTLSGTNADGTKNQNYRYRVFEFTVPLRNMIVLAGGP
jgi:type IV pilus assembly protein PilW